jgi:predicted trehalose synthase
VTNQAVSVSDGLPDRLSAWIARQRWYGAKGSEPHLERLGGWSVGDDSVRIHTHYFLDRQRSGTTLYQVPLTERATALDGREPIGMSDGRYVYDAPHDPAYVTTILGLILSEGVADGARGHRQPGAPFVVLTNSSVLRGEQSNTSVICQVEDGAPIMLKIFRTLHHGDNPDVMLQSAIAASGSRLVPRSLGSLTGEWRDAGRPGGLARGHLAFAQEFLPGAEDGWRVALRAAESGEDFSTAARALGEATAEVHATLASVLPTREPSARDIDDLINTMRARLDLAMSEVPTLARDRSLIESVLGRARTASWPTLQRIHGDYHLGQVLAVPGRGWVLVDFEGEPLRPMTERSEPGVTLRDVAGMLRSFDYAAGSVALTHGGESPAEWAATARHAFLDGYIASSGHDVRANRALLDAFEIDKALYEAVYESRNRPDWIAIPVAAIRRLAERSAR